MLGNESVMGWSVVALLLNEKKSSESLRWGRVLVGVGLLVTVGLEVLELVEEAEVEEEVEEEGEFFLGLVCCCF
jgi:hypothetical protein|tara:strand:+ start:607 stop:828 length:222 start_codon:yes stop_codon:yes gene_type:complete